MDKYNAHEIIAGLRARGMTQQEIGAVVGVPQALVSRWENGGIPPAASTILKLLALYEQKPKRRKKCQ